MSDKHVFNERLNRLEPVDRKCYYCAEEECEQVDDCYFVPLFKEKDKTNIAEYNAVKYSKVLVGIPRCKKCMALHQSLRRKASYYAVGIALSGSLLGILTFESFGAIVSVITGMIAGALSYKPLANGFIDKAGILNQEEGAHTSETVQDFVNGGWRFTQRAA
ncbi:MAG: hypothetical protein KGO82_08040 [Bacteroidota bacterium]|nr:hypothetical protein [Bacteroidota bacterium]